MTYMKIAIGILVLSAGSLADASGVVQNDGTSVVFEIVRTPTAPVPALAEATVTDEEGIHRLLIDAAHERYFGYTVRIAPANGRYQLSVGPLDATQERKFAALYGGSLGTPYAIEYPPPQQVSAGEPLLFELLVNPTTNEKVFDLIRVQSPGSRQPTTLNAQLQPGEIRLVNAVVKINGQPLSTRSWTPPGRYVYFFVCGRGRFVVTTGPVAGLQMTPATLRDAKTITFTSGPDRYEWTSAEPFVIGSPHLWVWHDQDYQCRPGETDGHGSGRELSRLRADSRSGASR